MNAPTPSDAAITALLRGEPLVLSSGSTFVEKLGVAARRALGLIWSNQAGLAALKPSDQAVLARSLFEKALPSPERTEAAEPTRPLPPGGGGPEWRLHHLWCQSVRGVAPFGEPFEFSIGGDSTLIYGPNGTGKSSLVNAICWVLTNKVVTDCELEHDHVSLYSPPKAGGRPQKLRDWPVVCTLPHGADPKRIEPNSVAVLTLKTGDGSRMLSLRRTASSFEESRDGIEWSPCPDLATHGITPLDVQLSISAATVFGRRSLESSPDTRHLLSMMLGYDALEELGGLVTGLSTALTKVAKTEAEDVAEQAMRLRERLRALPASLRPGHPLLTDLAALTGEALPVPGKIGEVCQAAAAAVAAGEAELASALGLEAGGKVPPGLADAATAAISSLSRPWSEIFPRLASIAGSAGAAFDAEGSIAPAAVADRLSEFESDARAKIEARLKWWRQEVEPGSRAALFIQAAAYFEPARHQCPVCDQSIKGAAVEGRLADLRGAAAELRTELRVFFRDLADEVRKVVPESIRGLATVSPAECVRDGWGRLKRSLGTPLAGLVAGYEPVVEELSTVAVPFAEREAAILPDAAEAAFREAATGLEEVLAEAWRGLDVARWAAEHLPALVGKIQRAITSPAEESASLYVALARGKRAAADVPPAAAVRDELAAAAAEAAAIVAAESRGAVLAGLRAALDELKNVGKYAEAEVAHVFGEIKDTTAAYFDKLYPNVNPDIALARLHLNKGRDKTVEAYLAAGGFEFPGQQVANAGCIRAVALAFYFALLARHPRGLGFVLMDDPLLSLDENHREAWSANVLHPCLATTQVILVTHQRQFLNNCRADFRPGRIVELNPRNRSRQITWRPGGRLENAAGMIEGDWNNTPVEMRKYREEVLRTLDAYSPEPFYTRKNHKDCLDHYARLAPPNPLAPANARIAQGFRDPKISRVLDAGSHAPTEADVTEPMVRECLAELLKVDALFRKELERLDEARSRDLRIKSVPVDPEPDHTVGGEEAVIIPMENLRVVDAASWPRSLALQIIGAAAAQTRGCVVDMVELPRDALLPPGGAVLVVGDGLAPLARPGQWALLADPAVRTDDGDYAAVIDRAGNHFLRRIWSANEEWLLEAINPLAGRAPVRVRKNACAVRKVIGVVYAHDREPKHGSSRLAREWHSRQDFPASPLADLHGVTIRGTSLEPIACDGNVVVVGHKIDRKSDLRRGMLAVVETDDPRVGNVIKRIYPEDRSLLLLSPNPIEPREPLMVSKSNLRGVWPVQGVLFDLTITDD